MHCLPEITELVSGCIRLNSELVRKPTTPGGMCLWMGGAGAALTSKVSQRWGCKAQFSAPLHPAAWTCACPSQEVSDIG